MVWVELVYYEGNIVLWYGLSRIEFIDKSRKLRVMKYLNWFVEENTCFRGS